MKKLWFFLMIFFVIVGSVVAIDLSGTVNGGVRLIQADNEKDSQVTGGGAIHGLRLQGSGELADGKFGGWFRFDPLGNGVDFGPNVKIGNNSGVAAIAGGIAWWQPIDMLKINMGVNKDGVWAKNGVAGWGFNQTAYDVAVADGSGNIWGGGFSKVLYNEAFFSGFDDNRLYLEFKPIDMIGINFGVPYIAKDGEELKTIFTNMVGQIDVNLDGIGNIALSYRGNDPKKGGDIYGFFDLSAIENLGVHFGIAYHIKDEGGSNKPFNIGLSAKYTSGAFGIKARTVFGIPMEDVQPFNLSFGLNPYYALNDNISAFFNMELAVSKPDGDATIGWLINPYIRIGAEWGPTFYTGIKVLADGSKTTEDKTKLQFAIPIAIMVAF